MERDRSGQFSECETLDRSAQDVARQIEIESQPLAQLTDDSSASDTRPESENCLSAEFSLPPNETAKAATDELAAKRKSILLLSPLFAPSDSAELSATLIPVNSADKNLPAKPTGCRNCGTHMFLRDTESLCAKCALNADFKEMLADRRISLEFWQKFTTYLQLPVEIKKIDDGAARFITHLLRSATHDFSFSQQTKLREGELLKWLIKNIPPTSPWRKNLHAELTLLVAKKAAIAEHAISPAENRVASDSEEHRAPPLAACQNAAAPIPLADGSKRQKISASTYREVAYRQGSFCYWCGVRVVREAELAPPERLIKNAATIIYLANGNFYEEPFGTIDHLRRVEDGGDNRVENLVISCYPCNLTRDRKTRAFRRSGSRQSRPACQCCGSRFFHLEWGCCSICGSSSPNPTTAQKAAPHRKPNGSFSRLKVWLQNNVFKYLSGKHPS